MAPWPAFVAAGAVLGALSGLFGVGGSSLATPILSLLGVPGLQAVASPLPATLPTAVIAAVPYLRNRHARPRAAAWTVAGALPVTIIGALLSQAVGGTALLVASGFVLPIVGQRIIGPISDESLRTGTARRRNRPMLVVASAGVGLFTGLLANGGGFLLVPMYLVLFGLEMTEAAGTSLLVIAVLTVPTAATHWALGHIDWNVAAALAVGSIPTSTITAAWAQKMRGSALRKAFGWFLIISGPAFAIYRLTQ